MITKESAKQIYNLYSQIEKSNEVITILEKCKEQYEKDNEGIDIIPNNWSSHKYIELHIPDRFLHSDASPYSGTSIYHISVTEAILVLQNHIVRLEKALEAEKKKAMEE
ncbi:MAG: hypothetical protein MJZ30_07465 [Paludibacteraceae bacterium]|nr:hypothetical protein [Paludibacteraceae bacterium]